MLAMLTSGSYSFSISWASSSIVSWSPGKDGFAGRRDVFAVAVDIYDYAMVGEFERIDLFPVEIGSGHHFHIQCQPFLLPEGRFVDHLFVEHHVERLYF